jgi:hypothetical protein
MAQAATATAAHLGIVGMGILLGRDRLILPGHPA